MAWFGEQPEVLGSPFHGARFASIRTYQERVIGHRLIKHFAQLVNSARMISTAFEQLLPWLQDIAPRHDLAVSRLSFRGTVDALRQWQELFEGSREHPRRVHKLRERFYQTMAGDPLLVRPDRSEPRAVKRRPKNFRLLTKPRHDMVVERCRQQSQKPSKKALN